MASSSITKNISKIVEEAIKGDGIWIFSDTECKTDKKLCYTWTTLFQAFQDKRVNPIKISPDWLKQKSESVDMLTILKGWWSAGNFRSKPANVEWKTDRKSVV